MKRRDFIKITASASVSLGSMALPMTILADEFGIRKLTILHTNDVHSRIEPFESGRNAGLGGVARRAALIKKIRNEEKNVLLLDAGDIFQGTPYFNFYHGEIEMKLMSELGYDAATIGNHDFDAGIEGLEQQLKHTNFPLVVSNYDFSDTVMNDKTKEVLVLKKGSLKIGLFGLGIELEGLVPKKLFQDTRYINPIQVANKVAGRLKHDEKCDLVICLSHLGYRYESKKVSDVIIAEQSKDIDIIIGGHTHTFMEEPVELSNASGKPVLVNQVGFGGINLGRIDVLFSPRNNTRFDKQKAMLVR